MILKQKKRILITLAYYYPNLTGMSLNIMNMAECLAKDGYDVTVITSRHEKDLPPREKINGVSVIRLTPLFRISRGVILPAFPFVAARHILENDIIQINSPMIENAFVAIFSKLLRKKLVIIHHGDLVLPEGLLNRFIEFTVLNLYKIAALLADKIISYSDDYAKHSRYFSLFPKKIEVIPPPIRITEPDPEGVERLIKKHDLEGKKLLGYAGRFVKEKRPELLIKTIP